jgi:hypothetical protein
MRVTSYSKISRASNKIVNEMPVEFEFNSWSGSIQDDKVTASSYMSRSGIITSFKFVHASMLLERVSEQYSSKLASKITTSKSVLSSSSISINVNIIVVNGKTSFNRTIVFSLKDPTFVEKVHINYKAGDLLVVVGDPIIGKGIVVLSGRQALNNNASFIDDKPEEVEPTAE